MCIMLLEPHDTDPVIDDLSHNSINLDYLKGSV